MKRWYVAQVKAGMEYTAMEHLDRQGFRSFCAEIQQTTKRKVRVGTAGTEVKELRATAIDRRPLKIFPGYLFVQFDVKRDRWRSINGTLGVIKLLPQNLEIPLPLPTNILTTLKDLIKDKQATRSEVLTRVRRYLAGDAVRVTRGAFTDHEGVFVDARKTCAILLLSCLGRQVEVAVEFSATERAAPSSAGAVAFPGQR